jgi:hypothetical protein
MTEMTWTTFTIGGKVPANKHQEFRDLIGEYFDQTGSVDNPHQLLDDALAEGKPYIVSGELNFGGADELEAACRRWGLTYHKSWDTKPGCFDAGIEIWSPGMHVHTAIECSADDNGEPTLGLQQLRNRLAEGKTLAEVIADLDLFDQKHVPKIELGTTDWVDPAEQEEAQQ